MTIKQTITIVAHLCFFVLTIVHVASAEAVAVTSGGPEEVTATGEHVAITTSTRSGLCNTNKCLTLTPPSLLEGVGAEGQGIEM
jgi:hypothetical protein